MNNKVMVSVPRELLDASAEWLEALSSPNSAERGVAQDLREVLAKPVEQHQGKLCDQLQADLTARDERIDRFEQVLQKVARLRGTLKQHGLQEEVDALLPDHMAIKRQAPWLDYAGHEIHEGDTMRHPDGMEFKVLYDSARRGIDCWRAYYLDETGLSLVLQIGDKGMAQVVKP